MSRLLKRAMATVSAGAAPEYATVREGKAEILSLQQNKVFYNPIQQFNRDLSVTAIRAWLELYGLRKRRRDDEAAADPYITILEALSATGLRAIRYGHEIPRVKRVVANDLLAAAVELIDRNIAHAGLQGVVELNLGDAIHYMSGGRQQFHVIDLDPYGTAAPFIDGAVQLVLDGGLLLVTCTDAGVLAGAGYPEKCFALYGGNNFGNAHVGGEANHEAGLRLVLQMIAALAAKYKKLIEPVLSLSIDFYVRVFVRVRTSPIAVKRLASTTMLTYHCVGCGHLLNQYLGRTEEREGGSKHNLKYMYPLGPPVGVRCPHCNDRYHLAGPMWGGALHSAEFIDKVLEINEAHDTAVYGTTERLRGMLTMARQELAQPFYFGLNQLSSFFKSPPIPIDTMCRALGNLGHNVSLTHAKRNCIKTDAPWATILQINRQWMLNCNHEALAHAQAQLAAKEKEKSDDKVAALIERLRKRIALLEQDPNLLPNLTEGMVGYRILQNADSLPLLEVDFDTKNEVSERVNRFRKTKIVRYQENPTKNWGPKLRPRE